MITAHIGDSSYQGKFLRQRMQRTSASPSSSSPSRIDRLLFDKDTYINALEDQLRKVTAATELAEDVREENEMVLEGFAQLEKKVNDFSSLTHAAAVRQETLCDRVEALEALSDRVTSLETQLGSAAAAKVQEQQDQIAAPALLASLQEKMVGLEAQVSMLHEQDQVTRARLEAAELANKALRQQCQKLETREQHREASTNLLRESVLPQVVEEMKRAQERFQAEMLRDLQRLRQEASMAESRTLAACTKQGTLIEMELAKLERQIHGVMVDQQEQQQQQQQQQRYYQQQRQHQHEPLPSLHDYLDGTDQDQVHTHTMMTTTTMAARRGEGSLEKKLNVMAAAFRHAEESHKHTLSQQQALVMTLQQSLVRIGDKSVQTAQQQMQVVLEVVQQLEERLTLLEGQAEREEGRQGGRRSVHEADRDEKGHDANAYHQRRSSEEADFEEELIHATEAAAVAGTSFCEDDVQAEEGRKDGIVAGSSISRSRNSSRSRNKTTSSSGHGGGQGKEMKAAIRVIASIQGTEDGKSEQQERGAAASCFAAATVASKDRSLHAVLKELGGLLQRKQEREKMQRRREQAQHQKDNKNERQDEEEEEEGGEVPASHPHPHLRPHPRPPHKTSAIPHPPLIPPPPSSSSSSESAVAAAASVPPRRKQKRPSLLNKPYHQVM